MVIYEAVLSATGIWSVSRGIVYYMNSKGKQAQGKGITPSRDQLYTNPSYNERAYKELDWI